MSPFLIALVGMWLTSSPSPVGTVEAFHRALASDDSARALTLLAEDVVVFESGHAELSREEYEREHLAIDIEFSKTTERAIADRSHRVVGDQAWVLTRAEVSGTFRDRPIHSMLNETMLLHRHDDSWRITHIHWSTHTLLESKPESAPEAETTEQ
ncbi:MAG: nuclear transport factor 2 family protein [Acidobacteriota bacterium]